MTTDPMNTETGSQHQDHARDRWASWLLEKRFGGDAGQRERTLAYLADVREEVLRRAQIRPGDTLLDVGCGDGLIGFGAADLVGPSGHVVLSDISADLLAVCREIAAAMRATSVGTDNQRFSFVQTGLPALDAIDSQSVDVATTRSVLIYVADIAASFAALHRVLRPGGRLSIFEPINRFGVDDRPNRLWGWGFDMTGMESIAAKVRAQHDTYDLGTMLGFDERDLIREAEAAGFVDIRMTYQAEITRQHDNTHGSDTRGRDTRSEYTVESLLAMAPNPLVPTLGEVVSAALEPAEEAAFRERIARELAAGRREIRLATTYLSAHRA
ncbi:MAG TPA: methyltransferase domain-containing protein [Micromonosporaceae bacterium]|nr:methyltransferase domain-containing protein [Micromonosporaceae bacterium]